MNWEPKAPKPIDWDTMRRGTGDAEVIDGSVAESENIDPPVVSPEQSLVTEELDSYVTNPDVRRELAGDVQANLEYIEDIKTALGCEDGSYTELPDEWEIKMLYATVVQKLNDFVETTDTLEEKIKNGELVLPHEIDEVYDLANELNDVVGQIEVEAKKMGVEIVDKELKDVTNSELAIPADLSGVAPLSGEDSLVTEVAEKKSRRTNKPRGGRAGKKRKGLDRTISEVTNDENKEVDVPSASDEATAPEDLSRVESEANLQNQVAQPNLEVTKDAPEAVANNFDSELEVLQQRCESAREMRDEVEKLFDSEYPADFELDKIIEQFTQSSKRLDNLVSKLEDLKNSSSKQEDKQQWLEIYQRISAEVIGNLEQMKLDLEQQQMAAIDVADTATANSSPDGKEDSLVVGEEKTDSTLTASIMGEVPDDDDSHQIPPNLPTGEIDGSLAFETTGQFANLLSTPNTFEANAYVRTRERWRFLHEEYTAASAAYRASIDAHYAERAGSWRTRNQDKLRGVFGVRPQLPPEILAQREWLFTLAQKYSEAAKAMRDIRSELPRPSEQVPPEVMERYLRSLARKQAMRNFEHQLEAQKKAFDAVAEAADAKRSGLGRKIKQAAEWVSDPKRARAVRLAGGATVGAGIGFLTGGTAPAFVLAVRALAAGAATGAAMQSQWVRKNLIDTGSVQKEKLADDAVTQKSNELAERLRDTSITAQELQFIYGELEQLYATAGRAKRAEVIKLMMVAVTVGAATGALSTQAMAEVIPGAFSVPEGDAPELPRPTPTEIPELAVGGAVEAPAPAAEAVGGVESPESAIDGQGDEVLPATHGEEVGDPAEEISEDVPASEFDGEVDGGEAAVAEVSAEEEPALETAEEVNGETAPPERLPIETFRVSADVRETYFDGNGNETGRLTMRGIELQGPGLSQLASMRDVLEGQISVWVQDIVADSPRLRSEQIASALQEKLAATYGTTEWWQETPIESVSIEKVTYQVAPGVYPSDGEFGSEPALSQEEITERLAGADAPAEIPTPEPHRVFSDEELAAQQEVDGLTDHTDSGVAEAPPVRYEPVTVQRGDTTSQILLDAFRAQAPEGLSEGMTGREFTNLLYRTFPEMTDASNPTWRLSQAEWKELGLRSGNPNLIYPGEEIDVNRLMEILTEANEAPVDLSPPPPRPAGLGPLSIESLDGAAAPDGETVAIRTLEAAAPETSPAPVPRPDTLQTNGVVAPTEAPAPPPRPSALETPVTSVDRTLPPGMSAEMVSQAEAAGNALYTPENREAVLALYKSWPRFTVTVEAAVHQFEGTILYHEGVLSDRIDVAVYGTPDATVPSAYSVLKDMTLNEFEALQNLSKDEIQDAITPKDPQTGRYALGYDKPLPYEAYEAWREQIAFMTEQLPHRSTTTVEDLFSRLVLEAKKSNLTLGMKNNLWQP